VGDVQDQQGEDGGGEYVTVSGGGFLKGVEHGGFSALLVARFLASSVAVNDTLGRDVMETLLGTPDACRWGGRKLSGFRSCGWGRFDWGKRGTGTFCLTALRVLRTKGASPQLGITGWVLAVCGCGRIFGQHILVFPFWPVSQLDTGIFAALSFRAVYLLREKVGAMGVCARAVDDWGYSLIDVRKFIPPKGSVLHKSRFIDSDVVNDRASSQIQAQRGPDVLLAARGRRSLAMQASTVWGCVCLVFLKC